MGVLGNQPSQVIVDDYTKLKDAETAWEHDHPTSLRAKLMAWSSGAALMVAEGDLIIKRLPSTQRHVR